MSYGAFWILALLGMLALPQVLGLSLSHLSRNEETRRWLGPAIAALVFGIGWYIVLNKPWRHLEYGKETCGTAGALFLVGLFVFVPVNLLIGSAIQFVAELVSIQALANPPLQTDGRVGRCAPSRVRATP